MQAASRRWLALALLVLGSPMIVAASDDAPVWPDLSTPPSRVGGGEKDAAVLVGVENYLFLPDIPGALDNVDAWYSYLTRTLSVPTACITLLRNDDASLEKVRKYAERAASEVEPGGTLWFVFVGHGASSASGDDGVLIGVDAQREADSVYARSMPRAELLALLNGGRQERSVVVLDACFSGRAASGEELVKGLQAYVPNRAAQATGDVAVLAAGRSDQFAGPLPGATRPAFSYLVLGALRGWGDTNRDGAVTAGEAVGYARDALATLVTDRDQTPELSGGLGEVTLARGREKGPDLAAMVLARGMSSSGTSGGATVSTGTSVDFQRQLAEFEANKRERERLEKEAADLERQIEQDRRQRYETAGASLQHQAQQDWLALAPFLETETPEANAAAELYVEKYGEASVTVDGATTPVEIAYVGEARQWLERFADAATPGSAGLGGPVIDQYGYEMVRFEAGEFWAGSPEAEEDRNNNETRHKVRLTRAFAIGTTEVTQELHAAVMGENPSHFKGSRNPVENVDWLDAVKLCNRLSEQEGLEPAYRISGETVTWDRTATGYRLPTEAEWENAARGGEEHVYSGSDDIGDVGWYDSNSGKRIHEVGGKRANGWGLYDMTGNAREWVWDWKGAYPSGTATDPVGPSTGSSRVSRGGSWNDGPRRARVANRVWYDPGSRFNNLGFRLARSR